MTLFVSGIAKDERDRRRQLTNFAVKLTLLAGAVGLALELFFYLCVLLPDQRPAVDGLHLLMSVTSITLGLLAIMLGVNRLRVIPYWVVSGSFLFTLIFLILFSDTPEQLLNGRATMFFLVPILLSGVLIHSNATFIFTSIMTLFLRCMK